MHISHRIKRLLYMVPGRQRFGVYRFLPFFFLLGGAMEWFMINVRIGKETFCWLSHPVGYIFATKPDDRKYCCYAWFN